MDLVVYSAINNEGNQVKRIGIDNGQSKKPVYPLVSYEFAAKNVDFILDNVSQVQGEYGMYWYLDLKETVETLGSR